MRFGLYFLLIVCAAHCACGQLDLSGLTTYNLPSGAELLVGNIEPLFSCSDKKYGYYADVHHSCKIFHICHPSHNSMTSFFCPNLTVFDQRTLSCIHEESDNLVACNLSPQLYYLNDNFGKTEAPKVNSNENNESQNLVPSVILV